MSSWRALSIFHFSVLSFIVDIPINTKMFAEWKTKTHLVELSWAVNFRTHTLATHAKNSFLIGLILVTKSLKREKLNYFVGGMTRIFISHENMKDRSWLFNGWFYNRMIYGKVKVWGDFEYNFFRYFQSLINCIMQNTISNSQKLEQKSHIPPNTKFITQYNLTQKWIFQYFLLKLNILCTW